MQQNRNIPWSVELDNDEIVLADSVVKVGVIQCEHEFLSLRGLLSVDLRGDKRKCEDEEEGANRNPTCHCSSEWEAAKAIGVKRRSREGVL